MNQARQERLLRLAWQFTRTMGPVFGDATAEALKRLKAAPERRGSGLGDEVTTSAQFDSTWQLTSSFVSHEKKTPLRSRPISAKRLVEVLAGAETNLKPS